MPTLQIVRRWMIRIGLLTLALACVGALALAHLAREAPAWWRQVNAADERTIRHADRVENQFVTVLYDERPTDDSFLDADAWRSKPWGVELRATDANAWLNARLPRWLRNQEQDFLWPEELQQLQVDFDGDRIRIGVLLDTPDRKQVLSATLSPALAPDGSLWMQADAVHLGRLPIPASWVLDKTDLKRSDLVPNNWSDLPEAERLFDVFAGQQPIAFEPVFKLGDGRRVRLLDIRPRDGSLLVTFRTEW